MLRTLIWCAIWSYVSCVHPIQPKILAKWLDFPLKLMLNNSLISPECRTANNKFLQLLADNDLNALKMLDATAKLPSGILSGNINQYGDFDECMEVETAQYCLVDLNLGGLDEPYSKYQHLVHSFFFFTDTLDDPVHRIPGFTRVRWGFCIPRECSQEDVVRSLSTNFGITVKIEPGMCQKAVKDETSLTFGDYAARLFFTIVILCVIISTVLDSLQRNFIITKTTQTGFCGNLLMCFSLRRNIPKLVKLKENNSKEIACLHGVRAISAFALFVCHKSMSLFFNPYINRTRAVQNLSQPWTIIGKNAIIYTDVFILISGLLNANALFNDLRNVQTIKFKDKLVTRIFRILPNVVALILFYTYILPLMGSGPLWPTIIDHHSVLCKQYMWRNIFFIHNYFEFENMCLTHTHQLGIDMQLFLVTPLLVYLIWKFKRIGTFILIFLALASTILRFVVSYSNELSSVIYFGISISKMFSVANLSYILPTHRATSYFIGVYLAYFLKYLKPKIPPSKIWLTFLWCIFVSCFLWSWVGQYHMVQSNYIPNHLETAVVFAVYPILWGMSVSFGIYVSSENLAGWLGALVNWKYFQISTKLAYAIYLVQFPVFFYNVGLTRHVAEYHAGLMFQIFEVVQVLVFSVILVILIETPFQNIKCVIFDAKKSQLKTINSTQTATIARKAKSG